MRKAMAICLIALMALSAAFSAQAEIGAQAPDFELATLDGGVFRLSEQRGKVVFLNIWATWCPPCVEEIPSIQKLAEAHPDDLVVIGASIDEDASDVLSFIKENGIAYAVGMDENYHLASDLFPTEYIPESVFISPNGTVADIKIGGASYEEMEQMYAAALKGQ